jgi:hypothetical protein
LLKEEVALGRAVYAAQNPSGFPADIPRRNHVKLAVKGYPVGGLAFGAVVVGFPVKVPHAGGEEFILRCAADNIVAAFAEPSGKLNDFQYPGIFVAVPAPLGGAHAPNADDRLALGVGIAG